jgi:signal transduction histidine kinase
VRIDVRLTDEGAARIAVIDGGPGITEEKMRELFIAFKRGETHGKRGMGLGLSIARQAAELLGGKLSVESQPGDGAQFNLEIPAPSA